jgi:GDP-L-fucose synthase|tara:strand:+ start:1783 stop:2697 length:915 start_codon:yes stop_codon:yes gene_type:complete
MESIFMGSVLVTGGSGLVGKHLKDILPDAVYISSKDFDLTDMHRVDSMMDFFRPKVVIHLAAKVGGIMDNINHPVEYLEENIMMNINVLKKCHEYKVDRVISVLSTCIYPDKVSVYPMKEKDLFNGPPTPTNFAYGFSKRCMATQIDSYVKQYDKKWCYLIPCNLYGEHDKYEEHHSHFVSALIKKIYESKDTVEVWGTGKPLRQFMHAEDLARVIVYMIENDIVDNFNVAPDYVHSIEEITKIGMESCGKGDLEIIYDNTKPDGQYRKDVDSSKLISVMKEFKFTPLGDGIKRVYDNFSQRYN